MASTVTKKTCAKCDKGGGTAMCYGCEEAFCTKHFIEHRQELSQQMDNIGQEYNVLRRDLTNEKSSHPILAHINQWEEESIMKIRTAAELARIQLEKLINQAQMNLKESVSKLSEELQSKRESDDYTEVDIKRWMNRLQEFRIMLDTPASVQVEYENDSKAAIRLIKVYNQQLFDSPAQMLQKNQYYSPIYRNLPLSDGERFSEIFGEVVLSQDRLQAKCLISTTEASGACGVGRYSSGIHLIRIQIQEIPFAYPFIGIINYSEKLKGDVSASSSCHGWWRFGLRVVSGESRKDQIKDVIQNGDEVNLIIDCDNQKIQLTHSRTQTVEQIQINTQLCAFPWKLFVQYYGRGTSVRILC